MAMTGLLHPAHPSFFSLETAKNMPSDSEIEGGEAQKNDPFATSNMFLPNLLFLRRKKMKWMISLRISDCSQVSMDVLFSMSRLTRDLYNHTMIYL